MGLRNREQFKDKRCFFVTTTCNSWQRIFTRKSRCDVILNSLNFVGDKYNSQILAYVLMPNHLHIIVVFQGENLLSNMMRDFNRTGDPEVHIWRSKKNIAAGKRRCTFE